MDAAVFDDLLVIALSLLDLSSLCVGVAVSSTDEVEVDALPAICDAVRHWIKAVTDSEDGSLAFATSVAFCFNIAAIDTGTLVTNTSLLSVIKEAGITTEHVSVSVVLVVLVGVVDRPLITNFPSLLAPLPGLRRFFEAFGVCQRAKCFFRLPLCVKAMPQFVHSKGLTPV